MISKVLPFVFLAAGTAGGMAAGHFLVPQKPGKPDTATNQIVDATPEEEGSNSNSGHKPDKPDNEYVKIGRPFVIPIIAGNDVQAFVSVTLSIETPPGQSEAVYSREPKLRDVFLRVLFDHANSGGFRGVFTQSDMLDPLRRALLEVARKELGSRVEQVLIVDINRQDS